MARMIPSILDLECPSPGEKEVYRRLRSEPGAESWIVLHSLDLAKHPTQVAGEVDFIAIIPEKGVLFLEVKAHHKIQRTVDGLWYYGSSNKPDNRGPFKQASLAMHALREMLVKKMPHLARVVFWSAVIAPYTTLPRHTPEWHPWQVIDSIGFWSRPLSVQVLEVLEHARQHLAQCPTAVWFHPMSKEPYPDECEQIADFYRPHFEAYISNRLAAEVKDRELKIYTEEQLTCLEGMEGNDRVVFAGPAGTGKTLLAIEAARRGAASGRKVLFVCFNRFLGEWLKTQMQGINMVDVRTIHELMMVLSGCNAWDKEESSYWTEELPEQALESMLKHDELIGRYDELVVDEAQDILRDSYLDVLDLNVQGGLGGGRWRMFGDFEKQAIYNAANLSLEDFKKRRAGAGVSTYLLRVNCRNTPKIATYAKLIGGLQPYYSRIRRADDGEDASVRFYRGGNSQQEQLIEALDDLYVQGFKGDDIVILSDRADGCCASKILESPWKERIKKYGATSATGFIRYATIHSFKGMEAKAIIVTDIEGVDSQMDQALLYIAITRALHRLTMLISDKSKQHFLKTMIANA